jgi:hypothetical protein
MRYIRVRASNGAVVVSSCRIAHGLSVVAVSFASACVPTADLSSYSSAASNATADPGDGRSPSPTRPPSTAPPGDDGLDSRDAPSSGESIGGGAPLDPGSGDVPSSSGDDSTGSSNGAADAGPRTDSGAPPFVPTPPDAAPPGRPACALEETTGPNGRCYVLVATPLAWEAARANCQQRGLSWDLTSIRSAADSRFVTSLVDGETWVGGSDGTTEETWAWVDDGFEFWQGEGAEGQSLNGAFINWFEDEPNGSTSSDCMRLLDDSRWADLECTELRPSVCEGPPS